MPEAKALTSVWRLMKITTFLANLLSFSREHILTELENEGRDAIVGTLATFPNQLEADDVSDFFSLAQYYASKTPQSFRRVSIDGQSQSLLRITWSPPIKDF